jgi:hypothetical protein
MTGKDDKYDEKGYAKDGKGWIAKTCPECGFDLLDIDEKVCFVCGGEL